LEFQLGGWQPNLGEAKELESMPLPLPKETVVYASTFIYNVKIS